MRPLRLVGPAGAIAPQFPADRAGRAIEFAGDRAQRQAGGVERVDSVSFLQVQAAIGHGQLHLAVKLHRLGRLDRFNALGVAIGS